MNLTLVGTALAVSLLGSLFAAADTALVSLSELETQVLVDGPHGALFRRFQGDGSRILARWLFCRSIAVSLTAALFTKSAEIFSSSVVVQVALATTAAMISYGTFAQVFISVARARPELVGIFALRYLRPLEVLAAPLAEPLSALGQFIERRFERINMRTPRVTESELQWAVSEGQKAGSLDLAPAQIIRNVLEFKERTVREVMVPRPRVTALDITMKLEDALGSVAVEGHSRYPVYRETIDNIVGLLYAKDLFGLVKNGRLKTKTMEEIVRAPVLFVAETQQIQHVLKEMQSRHLHLAVATDEFGGTSGIVTLEDVIEEIVGEIRDEFDEEPPFKDVGEGRLLADASLPVADLGTRLGRKIQVEGDFESIGGLVVHRAGRVPGVGEHVEVDDLTLIVREADATHVMKVEIVKPQATSSDAPNVTVPGDAS